MCGTMLRLPINLSSKIEFGLFVGRSFCSTSTLHNDHYAVLGVPKTAHHREIKSAFERLYKLHHQDKNSENYRKAFEAYNVLGDYRQRKMYDRGLIQTKMYAKDDKADGAAVKFERELQRNDTDPFSKLKEHKLQQEMNKHARKRAHESMDYYTKTFVLFVMVFAFVLHHG